MANFCYDLCGGLIGNCRNCLSTPITRTKIYWCGGITLVVILFIIIIVVSVPRDSTQSGRDALDRGVSAGVFYLKSDFSESTPVSKFDLNLLSRITKNKNVKIQLIGANPSCSSQYKDAVAKGIDQADYLSRLIPKATPLRLATTSGELQSTVDNGGVAAMMSVYGGHVLDSRLSVLRSLYRIGVRVFTLTVQGCSTPWLKAVSSNDTVKPELTDFSKNVIGELNRLGILIDIAGADPAVQKAVLDTSKAPVLAIGIGLKSENNNEMNLDSNTVVSAFVKNNGLLMLSSDCNLIAYDSKNCSTEDFTKLLNKAKTDAIRVAFGGSIDQNAKIPDDLSSEKLPAYFDSLYNKGFSLEFLKGLASQNFVDTLKKVEQVSKDLSSKKETDEVFFDWSLIQDKVCYTDLDPKPTDAPTPATLPTTQASTTTPTTTKPTKTPRT